MAYTPKTWQCNDTITAEDLNHIEQGIANSGGGTLVVSVDHFDEESGKTYFDRTWQEVYDAIAQGKVVTVPSVDDEEGRAQFFTVVLASSAGNYAVSVSDGSAFNADSADGYLYIRPL